MAHYYRIAKRHQQGFTLLDVLIAAIVLSVSLLGLIVLQGVSKYSSPNSDNKCDSHGLA